HASDALSLHDALPISLEWLALALSDADLRQPWVQDAANALALMILDQQDASIEGGSLYHATHGLLLYYARVYDRTTLGPKELHLDRKSTRLNSSHQII